MPLKSFTKRWLNSLQSPQKTILYIDKNIKNLILRHHPSNKKSFYICLNINGLRTYRFIGTYPELEPDYVKEIVKNEVAKNYISVFNRPTISSESKSFNHYILQFMEEHTVNIKPTTKKLYETLLNAQIIPYFKNISITEISHNHIIRLKNDLKEKTTTYNRCHQLLNVFFKYCLTHAIISNNPLDNVKQYKENIRQEYLTPDKYKNFIKSTYELLQAKSISTSSGACILFILLSGCRSSEAYTLKHSYIDFKNDIISLPYSKTGFKKIFLSNALKQLLQSIPKHKNNDYVFVGRWGKNHIVNLTKPFKKILEHANIKDNIVIHSLRHSWISAAASSGLSLQSIQASIQHKNIKTTENYTHLSDQVAATTSQQVGVILTKNSEEVFNQIIQAMRL